MFFGGLTIAINGFSMVFLFFYHRFQWFSMVLDHWSNDAMVSMDRCGLGPAGGGGGLSFSLIYYQKHGRQMALLNRCRI